MKSVYLLIAFLSLACCQRLSCQQPETEIITIPEVVVTEKNAKFFSDDQTTITITASHPQVNRQQSLGAVLERESPAIVRSYGSTGALVSLSLHGTGTNHASVSWNGFPVNSPSTGQADLSLIPFGFMQSVEMISGASGALFGSGTFGGVVDMVNEADWNNRFSFHVTHNQASFHTRSSFLSLKAGGRKLQYMVSALDTRSENDFVYRDRYLPGSPAVRAGHNAFEGRGIMQNIHLNAGNGNFVEAGAWIQQKRKEIPSILGSYNDSHARQADNTFRAYLNHSKHFTRSVLLLKTAWFTDDLRYTDKHEASDADYAIDSRIAVSRIMGGVEYRRSFSQALSAGAGISAVHTAAATNNYVHDIAENDYAIYGNLKLMLADLVMNTGIRQEFCEGTEPSTQLSFGLRYRMGDRLILRSNISSKFRKPTLNERYWKPGGNPGLRPEKGRGGEISGEVLLVGQEGSDGHLTVNGTVYYQSIDNWIQWIATDSLTPVEYKHVHAGGADLVLQYRLAAGQVSFTGNLNYSFNHSVIKSTYDGDRSLLGKQLIYVPRHMARMNFNLRYRGWLAGFYGSVTGNRQTLETGDPYAQLPAYCLIDLVAGFEKQLGKVRSELHFRIENLLDSQYEAIRSYPMPGRAFHLTLALDFTR